MKVKLKLENLYGGDGIERPHTVEQVKLSRTRAVEVRRDVGVPVERLKKEKQVETAEKTAFTFKRDKDGTPMYRIGGVHGKLWGAMRQAGHQMYQVGKAKSKAAIDRIMQAVQISPQWVRLEKAAETEMDVLPQILAGIGSSMIQMYYDVIPEAECEVTLRYPEELDGDVEKLLDYAQTVPFGNKRRGTLTVLKREGVSS